MSEAIKSVLEWIVLTLVIATVLTVILNTLKRIK